VLFNTPVFLLGFLPLALAGFFVAGRLGGNRAALGFVAVASLVFYGWWDIRFVPLLAGSILGNYWLGQRILLLRCQFSRPSCPGLARAPTTSFCAPSKDVGGRAKPGHDGERARTLLITGVTINLALLAWFKYAGFLSRAGAELLGLPAPGLSIALPLAISFFTFQQVMFLVDSARGERPDCGFLPYAAFIAFFPHLIAGPIVRPREIIPQLLSPALVRPRAEAIAEGLTIFLLGLAKKAVLADMFGRFADVGFNAAAQGATLTLFEAWYALLAYALQIYFDFSGYSDMAIGLAHMLNVRFPLNFESPYRASSIADFWRRWHITLGAFLRDYVYVPLGGSRRARGRHLANLFLIMLLCGLWHGAAWRFVLWGGLHGAFLCTHALWRRAGYRMAKGAAHFLTLGCVLIAWVPFRAEGFQATCAMLKGLSGANGIALPQLLVGWLPWLGDLARPVASLPSLGDARTLSFPEVTACLALGWAIVLAAPELHALGPRARGLALTASFALTMQAVFFAPRALPFLYFQF
jgi:alginate O-acetyltransferase complex protein AlgI